MADMILISRFQHGRYIAEMLISDDESEITVRKFLDGFGESTEEKRTYSVNGWIALTEASDLMRDWIADILARTTRSDLINFIQRPADWAKVEREQ